jgi:LysM repeat protein
MTIHTVCEGETVFHIARKYGVSPAKIIENNGLVNPDKISVGQKLLILTPTRTYTVRGGDTLKSIAGRFGVKERSILRANPYLSGIDATYPEEVLAIRYDTPIHGAAVLNGYYYDGCSRDRLMLALAHCNLITVSAYRAARGGRLECVFDDGEVIRTVRDGGRAAIMRVYDAREYGELIEHEGDYRANIVKIAKDKGYAGVALGAYRAAKNPLIKNFLFDLKRDLISAGLHLFYEYDGEVCEDGCDIADGCVLIYEKCALDEIPSFEDGERKFYTEFAERQDSSKAFLDLSPFAYAKDRCITKAEAESIAYKMKSRINYDPEKMICSFDYTSFGRGERGRTTVRYEAMENIKAKLDLAGELGFMGISFDIMRVPIEHLMMISTSFACGADYMLSSFEI